MKDQKPIPVVETSIFGVEPLLWFIAAAIIVVGGICAAVAGFACLVQWLS